MTNATTGGCYVSVNWAQTLAALPPELIPFAPPDMGRGWEWGAYFDAAYVWAATAANVERHERNARRGAWTDAELDAKRAGAPSWPAIVRVADRCAARALAEFRANSVRPHSLPAGVTRAMGFAPSGAGWFAAGPLRGGAVERMPRPGIPDDYRGPLAA